MSKTINRSLTDLFKNTGSLIDESCDFMSKSVNCSLIDLFKNTDSLINEPSDSLQASQWIIYSSICSKTLIHLLMNHMTLFISKSVNRSLIDLFKNTDSLINESRDSLYEQVSESFTHWFL